MVGQLNASASVARWADGAMLRFFCAVIGVTRDAIQALASGAAGPHYPAAPPISSVDPVSLLVAAISAAVWDIEGRIGTRLSSRGYV